MKYAAILASGTGSRITAIDYPKQFYKINDKPIIIYTIEKIVYSNSFDIVYIAINPDYYDYTTTLLQEFNLSDQVLLIKGGKTRMDTIDIVVNDIVANNTINDDDIILIHDAVRPFITNKIINDSIEGAQKYGAVVATIPAVDTIIASTDKEKVTYIPDRSELNYGQSPDTFNLKEFIQMEGNLSEEQRKQITGTSQICTYNHKEMHIIAGDPINFKITTNLDLMIAEKIIMEGLYEKHSENARLQTSLKFKKH